MFAVLFIDFKVEKDASACSLLLDTFFGGGHANDALLRYVPIWKLIRIPSPTTLRAAKSFMDYRNTSNAFKCSSHGKLVQNANTNIAARCKHKVFRVLRGFFAYSLCIFLSFPMFLRHNKQNFCLQNFCGYFISMNDDDYKIMVMFASNIYICVQRIESRPKHFTNIYHRHCSAVVCSL